jgi:hypothetical protein
MALASEMFTVMQWTITPRNTKVKAIEASEKVKFVSKRNHDKV